MAVVVVSLKSTINVLTPLEQRLMAISRSHIVIQITLSHLITHIPSHV